VALLHDHAALGDRAYDRRQQPVLLGEHAQAQRFLVVVVEHGHRRLRDHDPAHHARGDELHGAARDLQAIAQDFALALIVGVVVVEVVFAYPGLGQLLVDSVGKRDLPLVQAATLIFASTYVALNVLADVLSIVANPRLLYPK